MASSTKIFSAFQLHDLQLANRIIMSPMTRGRAGDSGVPQAIAAEYYAQRASVGLIVTEGTSVSLQARGWVGAPGIYTDEQEAGWRRVVEATHSAGGKIFLQLWHTGRASHSSFHDGQLPVSASAVKHGGEYIHTPTGKQPYDAAPRALETAEVAAVVEDYRLAAVRAKSAGFDGVELHGANGYLIEQFLQSKTNQRTDQYGGSIENRYRFLDELLTAVTSVFPSTRVAVRLSPNSAYNDMGSPEYREQTDYTLAQLDKRNLAFLDLVDGLGFGFHNLGEPYTLKDARAVYSGFISCNCGYSFEQGRDLVESGQADLFCVGRPLISNPDFVERVKHGHPLAENAPFTVWYSPGPEGYIDYPAYSAQ